MKEAATTDGFPQAQLGTANLRFEVTGGLHEGVDLSLEDGDYTVGCTGDADIILSDAGVAARHLILCIENKQTRVEAIGGPIRIGDEAIEKGFGYEVSLPAVIGIGDASIKLTAPVAFASAYNGASLGTKISSHTTPAVLGGVVAVFLISVAVHGMLPSDAEQRAPRTAGVAASSPLQKAPDKADKLEIATTGLKLKLKQAGLEAIEVTSDGTRLEASGKIPEERMGEWTSIQRWFDENFAPQLMLSANVTGGGEAPAPPLHLEAIWLGERPHIVADNGMRYYEGAVTNSGWILQSIQNNRIMLRKGGETLSLNYR